MDRGLFICSGPNDFMRNPAIQGVCDNLDIAKRKYKIHIDKIELEQLLQYVRAC